MGLWLHVLLHLNSAAALTPDATANHDFKSPLHEAVKSGDLNQLGTLLEAGADVNAPDPDGETLLHLACDAGDVKLIGYLLDRGADAEAADTVGARPLHFCAMRGHAEAVKLLLKRGANPGHVTLQHQSPLHLAGNDQVVSALLPNPPLLNTLNGFGYTPLHAARHSDVARKLLDFGADLRIRTPSGRTPMEIASIESLEKSAGLSVHSYMLGRLRGLLAQMPLSLTNISTGSVRDIRVTAESPACSIVVTPPLISQIRPTERFDLTMTMTKDKDLPEGDHPIFIKVFLGDRLAGTVDLRVDTRSIETPEDQGMIRLAKGNLRPAGSRIRYLAYLGAPLVIFVVLFLFKRRTKSPT